MSRETISKLIAEKIARKTEAVSKADSLDEKNGVLVDYKLYFDGVEDALKAVGSDAEDISLVGKAKTMIVAEQDFFGALQA